MPLMGSLGSTEGVLAPVRGSAGLGGGGEVLAPMAGQPQLWPDAATCSQPFPSRLTGNSKATEGA